MAAEASATVGRRRITSRAELEHAAFELFDSRGFENTTIDDIAAAAGIGRRTFFRYFPSKNDIPWGDFDAELERLRLRLRACSPDTPLMDALAAAVIDFNQVPADQAPWHRRRMSLILRVPALQAHSTLRYAAWRRVIAEYVGQRTGQSPDDLTPSAIAYALLGVAVAAYEQWLSRPGADLGDLLGTAMRDLASAYTRDWPTQAPRAAGGARGQ